MTRRRVSIGLCLCLALALAACRLDVVEALLVGHHLRSGVTTPSATRRLSKWGGRPSALSPGRCASSSSAHDSRRLQKRSSNTSLNLLVDVPDGFFAVSFFMLGLLLSVAKKFARVRLEERAWEQRLAEGRVRALREDPTLTELDLRRAEAATEWSAYGASSSSSSSAYASSREPVSSKRGRAGRRVAVMEDDRETTAGTTTTANRMSDDDIREFERQYGVAYDPYYDDPYEADELPEGKFMVDKQYGDRIYEDGEIFYKDSTSGLFYRQGSKPRNYRFFG